MVSTTMLTALRRSHGEQDSRSEAAYRILKEKIVTLELPPASLLNEAQLMAELELGRTPIREALRRLAFEKLVVILPRRGTIVADFNISDLQKIFELRLELEPFAVRLAAQRATAQQVADMEALLAEGVELLEEREPQELIWLDREAHKLLARAAHNEFLEDTLDWLYTHVLRLWYSSLHRVSHLPEAIQEHQAMVAAIKAGEAEQAAQIMAAHIASFQDEFRAVLGGGTA